MGNGETTVSHVLKILMCLFIVIGLQPANAGAPSAESLASEIIAKSGMMVAIEGVAEAWRLGVNQGITQARQAAASLPSPPKPAKVEQLRKVLVEAFSISEAETITTKRFIADLSIDDMNRVLEWMDSPLGQRITQLENRNAQDHQTHQPHEAEALLAQSPNPERRRALIAQLLEESAMIEHSLNILKDTSLAMALAMQATLAPNNISVQDIRQKVSDNIEPFRQAIFKQIWTDIVFTYQELSDEELSRYRDFYRTPAGRKYEKSSMSALNDTFVEVGRRAGEEVARVMRQTVAGAACPTQAKAA